MTQASVPLRTLTAALAGLFAFDNLLLLGLLGVHPLLVGALALCLPLVFAGLIWKIMPAHPRVGMRTIALCFAIAIVLLMLGGEGRLFYATADWQIRDAVLADMGNHRWPFDYMLEGRSQILRAPVGMYLVPALLGGASQLARDWVLLAHNSLILGLILAQAAALFDSHRARLIGLAIFLLFSGLDILGNLVRLAASAPVNWAHLERWASAYQYSSHITQIFWVPQHAFASWMVALTYLLWRRKLAPIGLFAASIPLAALWSPFALFGALPFAVFAGLQSLRTGVWGGRDVLACLFALILAVPALFYVSAGAAEVGSGLHAPVWAALFLILLLEVLPFLWPLLRDPGKATDRITLLIVGACLILMPLITIGASNDFQMRASIMPLALLAFAFADWAGRVQCVGGKAFVMAIVALGSVTGMVEIANAIRFAPAPVPRCSLPGIWNKQTGLAVPYASYFADRQAFPISIVPADRVASRQPAQCWDRPWLTPRNAGLRP